MSLAHVARNGSLQARHWLSAPKSPKGLIRALRLSHSLAGIPVTPGKLPENMVAQRLKVMGGKLVSSGFFSRSPVPRYFSPKMTARAVPGPFLGLTAGLAGLASSFTVVKKSYPKPSIAKMTIRPRLILRALGKVFVWPLVRAKVTSRSPSAAVMSIFRVNVATETWYSCREVRVAVTPDPETD